MDFSNLVDYSDKIFLGSDLNGKPLKFLWNKCKLETVSYGHGITTTPLQAASAYASISNGGIVVKPTLIKNKNTNSKTRRIVSLKTSKNINNMH